MYSLNSLNGYCDLSSRNLFYLCMWLTKRCLYFAFIQIEGFIMSKVIVNIFMPESVMQWFYDAQAFVSTGISYILSS